MDLNTMESNPSNIEDPLGSTQIGKPTIPNIKQTPKSTKALIVGINKKKKGCTTNKEKCNHEAMASIDEGSKAKLEELLHSKKFTYLNQSYFMEH